MVESGGGEICHGFRPALVQPSHHNGSRFFPRRHSGRSVMLTTHLLLVPGCEWVGAIHPSPLCACIGMSWVDLYLCYLWAVKRNAAEPYYAGTNFSCTPTQDSGRWLFSTVSRRTATTCHSVKVSGPLNILCAEPKIMWISHWQVCTEGAE